jgi:hypothetical protein
MSIRNTACTTRQAGYFPKAFAQGSMRLGWMRYLAWQEALAPMHSGPFRGWTGFPPKASGGCLDLAVGDLLNILRRSLGEIPSGPGKGPSPERVLLLSYFRIGDNPGTTSLKEARAFLGLERPTAKSARVVRT